MEYTIALQQVELHGTLCQKRLCCVGHDFMDLRGEGVVMPADAARPKCQHYTLFPWMYLWAQLYMLKPRLMTVMWT